MGYTIYNYKPNWKKVKGNHKKARQICPRCNNDVEFDLVCASYGFAIALLVVIPTQKDYAYKCPICTMTEEVPNQLAKALMKG